MSGALKTALQRHAAFCAQKLGPIQPEWYVFPLSNRTRPVDPTRPVTSLKTAWETVRTAAGVQCRLHDLRHRADSPVMPTVSKGDSPTSRLARGVPCLADRQKSA
jgi:hypothetical protein